MIGAMTRKRVLAAIVFLAITLFSTLGSVAAVKIFPFLTIMGAWVEDLRVANLLPVERRHPDIAVVAVTEDTLRLFPYRSPVDRRFMSELLRTLHAKGVKAISVDFLFDQPTEPDKDRELAQTLRDINKDVALVVAFAGQMEGLDGKQVAYLDDFLPPDIRGFANLARDPFDGTVRAIFPGRQELGLGFVRGMAPRLAEKLGLHVSTETIPISWRGRPEGGGRSFRVFPAHALKVIPETYLKDKIVLVGSNLTLTDLHRTPFAAGIGGRQEPETPGVFIHAHALAQLLGGRRPIEMGGWGGTVQVFGFTFLAVALSFLAASLFFRIAAILGFVAALWIGGVAVFWWQQVLVPLVTATLSVAISMWVVEVYFGRKQRQEKRLVRDAFSQYLSPHVVRQLVANPELLKLGGEKREMSLLFCDVRDFTSISEHFDAGGLTKLINDMLTPLTAVILERQGTVDKYMGDCIMAFWNAPLDDRDHARHTCLSALAMQAEMGPLNDRLAGEAERQGREHIPLRVGIGINTGEVVVGNMGSNQRFDYSVLGDEVNLASRLEGQCKTYGVDIIIGENTRAGAADLAAIEIDFIRVKGKTEATRIFALLGDEGVASDDGFRALSAAHQAMLSAYRGQDWQTARQELAACRKLTGGLDLTGLHDLYEARMTRYETAPPNPDWDGVFVAEMK